MRLKIQFMCGLMALAASSAVMAGGFVDERTSAARASVGAGGVLMGDFAMSEWSQKAPASSVSGVALSLAIVRLVPINLPSLEMNIPDSLVDIPVTWSEYATRRSALQEIAQSHAINISFEGNSVHVSAVANGKKNSFATSGAQPARQTAVASAPVRSFDVQKDDKTLREVIKGWAATAGWIHEIEHWAVDRDFPIAGTADQSVFGNDFKDAARKLLSSTELTDMPLQPCFYSNNVIRVVSKAELCDKAGK